jgi:hypothetical protein
MFNVFDILDLDRERFVSRRFAFLLSVLAVTLLVLTVLHVPITIKDPVETGDGDLQKYRTTTVALLIQSSEASAVSELTDEVKRRAAQVLEPITPETSENLLTSDDCYRDAVALSYGELSYYPGNRTATFGINSTEAINSTFIENMTVVVSSSKDGYGRARLKAGDAYSEDGLIVSGDESEPLTDFPLQPLNITVLGQGNISGIKPGGVVSLRYYRKNVRHEEFGCGDSVEVPLFKVGQDGIKFKTWNPYLKSGKTGER